MCGRYTYFSSEELLKEFDLQPEPNLTLALELPDNYNVSPGAHMPVIVRGEQEHVIEFMVWGLIPSWSKNPDSAMKLINARAEGLVEKPMWKRLVNNKRCVVPARGFYEWRREGAEKLPYYITPKHGKVFSFAGLWDSWQDSEGVLIHSYSIITTAPNKEMSAIHDRMPAILDKKRMDIWLSPVQLDAGAVSELLSPLPDDSLEVVRVSKEVNNARHNSRELIYPLEQ